MKAIALSCWKAFDLHGYARVDFRVDKDRNPFVLEVNTNPCLSKDAGFIAACRRGGAIPSAVFSSSVWRRSLR